jgi:uncharacterized coiled-coil protein SlyX
MVAAMKRTMKAVMKSAKKAKKDDSGKHIKALVDVLTNPECDVAGPSTNKDMLVGALPLALGDYSDVRHEYQTTVAKIVGEVLQGWVAKWEGKVAEAKAACDTTASELASATGALEAAKTAVTAQKDDVKACKEALKAASAEEKESKEALTKANGDVSEFDAKLSTVVASKDSVSMVYNSSFLVLKAAEGVPASEAKGHLKKIVPTLKKISSETSLQIAISPALEKKPDDRGQFDSMAIDGVEASFKAEIAKLEGEIAAQDDTKKALEGAVAEAKATHDAKHAKKEECKAALKASEESLAEKEKASEAAEKAVAHASTASHKALVKNKKEESGLDHAKGSVATYQLLLERSTPPPEPEEEEEEPPAEEAPAEATA